MCSLFRAFVKSTLLQNVCTFVIRCVLPALLYLQISGSDYGRVSTTDKTFGPFSECDFSPKKTLLRIVKKSTRVIRSIFEPRHEKTNILVSDTNRAVQSLNILCIKEVEGLYNMCSENKGAVQLSRGDTF